MINLTKLYCGVDTVSDPLRYGLPAGQAGHRLGPRHGAAHPTDAQPHQLPASAGARKPIVVWTMGRRCNLHCVHCYANSADREYPGELSAQDALHMLEDLADFQIPALLLSGGEPLLQPNFYHMAAYAKSLGLRLTLSTNGTLINREVASWIKQTGFSYVGISFDGLGAVNDRFRGHRGAFAEALSGVRHLQAAGQKVGLRFTLTRRNVEALPQIFQMVEQEGIHRVCFYHLVYSGRGSRLAADDLTHQETRHALDAILAWTRSLADRRLPVEVLTVDNHADGVYLYLKLLAEDPARAEQARQLLTWNGGGAHSSGVGIANVDSYGDVHPDQFWQHETLGNVRERPFSQIWTDADQPLLKGLRNRLPLLKGRCGNCRWKPLCGGSFRVRALQAYGDPWAEDPACYLSDHEISS